MGQSLEPSLTLEIIVEVHSIHLLFIGKMYMDSQFHQCALKITIGNSNFALLANKIKNVNTYALPKLNNIKHNLGFALFYQQMLHTQL